MENSLRLGPDGVFGYRWTQLFWALRQWWDSPIKRGSSTFEGDNMDNYPMMSSARVFCSLKHWKLENCRTSIGIVEHLHWHLLKYPIVLWLSLHDFSGHGWGSTTMPSLGLSSRENVISADEKSSSPVTDAERCGDAEIRMSDTLWKCGFNIAIEHMVFFHGKIHYFDWAMFNSYVTNYQRVCSFGCSIVDYIKQPITITWWLMVI